MSRRVNGQEPLKRKNSAPLSPSEEKQQRLLVQETGHFSMIRALHLADLITLGNGFCGIMSIFSSLRYCLETPLPTALYTTTAPASKLNLWLALTFMPFGLLFDFLDGRVARWRKKTSLMGAQLDSLADLISFGVSPAVAAFAIGIRSPVDHLFLTFFALCGLARLARFNVTSDEVPHDASGKAKYFEGTPIPSSLGVVAWIGLWVYKDWIGDNVPFGVAGAGSWWEFHPVVLTFVLHGCAMVSKTLHVPKP